MASRALLPTVFRLIHISTYTTPRLLWITGIVGYRRKTRVVFHIALHSATVAAAHFCNVFHIISYYCFFYCKNDNYI